MNLPDHTPTVLQYLLKQTERSPRGKRALAAVTPTASQRVMVQVMKEAYRILLTCDDANTRCEAKKDVVRLAS